MIDLIILLCSFAALLWSAKQLIQGASGIAYYYHLPPALIGFSLVGLGISAPEIIIAIRSSFDNLNDIALGNAIGSNIANIGLVMGIIALLRPISVQATFLKREFPLLFLAMLFTYSLMLDGYVSIIDSCLALIVCLIVSGYLLFKTRPSSLQKKIADQFQLTNLSRYSIRHHYLNVLIGLVVLLISAKFLIDKTTILAAGLGLSSLLISLTVVGLGSSLPELVTAILAVKKGADDLAVGTILGANIFNLLTVLIFPGIIHPAAINHDLVWRDMPVMFVTTLILWWMHTRSKKMTRWHGGLLIVIYICYIISLIISAVR